MSKDTQKNVKIKSIFALRHGAFAIVFTIIVIAIFAIVNVLATALTSRFPLNIDLTAQGDFTISQDNIEYIKSVSRPVTLTVCANEKDYASYMNTYLQTTYSGTDTSGGKYFAQTLTLLSEYAKHNSNINVVFADPQSPSFADVQKRVSASAALAGAILVESTFELEGKEVYHNKILNFNNLYELEDPTNGGAAYYGGYIIGKSNVESAITSAIYSVTSDKTTEVAFISARMPQGLLAELAGTLSDNNFHVSEIDNLMAKEIAPETEVLIIGAPDSDYSQAELAKIDAFLDNNGERGKTLLFFASSTSPYLTNLYAFLSEWGINIESGSVNETEPGNHMPNKPGTIGLLNRKTAYTEAVNDLSRMYMCSDNVPMMIGFKSQGNRETTELIATGPSAVIRPDGAPEDWNASAADKHQFSAAVLSTDLIFGDNYSEKKSHILAFSSVNFVGYEWAQYEGSVGNMELVLDTVNSICGRNSEDIKFTARTITNKSFADKVTASSSFVMIFIFVAIIPISLIFIGIIVFIRRKNR